MTFWVAGAVVGSSLIGSMASGNATDAQSNAAAASDATQRYFYDTTRSDYAPYRQSGYGALDQINALLGINAPSSANALAAATSPMDANALRSQLAPQFTTYQPQPPGSGAGFWDGTIPGEGQSYGQVSHTPVVDERGLQAAINARLAQQSTRNTQPVAQQNNPMNALAVLQNTPGYQFGLNQGMQALDRSAAARGGLYSGQQIKAAQRYGQDYAGTKLGEQFNRLASVAGLGQTATGGTASAGQNAGNQISANQQNLGNALGAGAINQGNVWGNAVNQLGAYGNRNGWFSGGGAAGGGIDQYGYLGGPATAGDYSDARLKTNIRPIGRTPKGNTLYAWDWKTGGSGRGVIAQEVMHIPGAVSSDADGLLMVDYTRV